MRSAIEAGLKTKLDGRLVSELLDAHTQAKEKFYLGGLRLSEVEAGRFCEAAFRILQQIKSGTFDALGKTLDTEKLIRDLAQTPASLLSESVRLHIPRSLRVVYDIRNKRDAAHLADGIDPNLQDATLVISVLDWILAEFIRLYHNVSANDAQLIVETIVTRKSPAIQDFDGFLKGLRPKLAASDLCLLFLYQRGSLGATIAELSVWVHPKMRANLARTLQNLTDNKLFVHFDSVRYLITRLGQQEVEQRRLTDPN